MTIEHRFIHGPLNPSDLGTKSCLTTLQQCLSDKFQKGGFLELPESQWNDITGVLGVITNEGQPGVLRKYKKKPPNSSCSSQAMAMKSGGATAARLGGATAGVTALYRHNWALDVKTYTRLLGTYKGEPFSDLIMRHRSLDKT